MTASYAVAHCGGEVRAAVGACPGRTGNGLKTPLRAAWISGVSGQRGSGLYTGTLRASVHIFQ